MPACCQIPAKYLRIAMGKEETVGFMNLMVKLKIILLMI